MFRESEDGNFVIDPDNDTGQVKPYLFVLDTVKLNNEKIFRKTARTRVCWWLSG